MTVEAEEIERRAAAALSEVPEWIWDGESLPIPVETIAESCFDLLIRDVERMDAAPDCPPLDAGQSLSGLFLPREREIWVNAAEGRQWPPRRRFTIGHELGHCVLHQDRQRSLFCRHGSVDPEGQAASSRDADPASSRPPLDPIEEEANFFAAALLMPAALIERHYRAIGSRGDRFTILCERFGASNRAMQKRLRQVI